MCFDWYPMVGNILPVESREKLRKFVNVNQDNGLEILNQTMGLDSYTTEANFRNWYKGSKPCFKKNWNIKS